MEICCLLLFSSLASDILIVIYNTLNKMCEPNYQELVAKDVPLASDEGVKVKVIAGESLGVKVMKSSRSKVMRNHKQIT